MSTSPLYTVERTERMTFSGPDMLATHDLMSPFVWDQGEGSLGLLLRVVEGSSNDEGSTGSIWYGTSDNGLHFTIDGTPVLTSDKGGLDEKGCEDPTLVQLDDEVIIFYSGVDARGDGHLLWASGPDVQSLTKHGIARTAADGEENVKEAEIVLGPGGKWIMGFEFADADASRIGYADGEGPTGPWRKTKQGFSSRPDRFDSWHLSPGPMDLSDPDHPVMFYNGATRDATWAVGWIVFDLPADSILDRCKEPLIAPPEEEDGRRMAFAASLIRRDDRIHLYVSLNDSSCHRVVLKAGR